MLERLTSEQLTEWQAYDRLEPIGQWRDDYRIAYLISAIASMVGGSAINPIDIMENMQYWNIKKKVQVSGKKQSVEEMKSILISIASGVKDPKGL